jgi:hypothetical protein
LKTSFAGGLVIPLKNFAARKSIDLYLIAAVLSRPQNLRRAGLGISIELNAAYSAAIDRRHQGKQSTRRSHVRYRSYGTVPLFERRKTAIMDAGDFPAIVLHRPTPVARRNDH